MTKKMVIDADKFAGLIDEEVAEYKRLATGTENVFTQTMYSAIAIAMNKTAKALFDASITVDDKDSFPS